MYPPPPSESPPHLLTGHPPSSPPPTPPLPPGTLPLLHSRPGAPSVFYLDFNGGAVTNTYWTDFSAKPYSLDADPDSFNEQEQSEIVNIWARVAEDYAPFDVDITTERPATFNSAVLRCLITSKVQTDGSNMPYHTSGGVAYLYAYKNSQWASKQPALVFYDNLSRRAVRRDAGAGPASFLRSLSLCSPPHLRHVHA